MVLVNKKIFFLVLVLCFVNLNVAEQYRGSYLTWLVNQTDDKYFPANTSSSESKIHIKFATHFANFDYSAKCISIKDPNGGYISSCWAPQRTPLQIFYGLSISSQPFFHRNILPQFSCVQRNGSFEFIHLYSDLAVVLPREYFYRLRYSGCCWSSGLVEFSRSSWNIEAVISLQKGQNTAVVNNPPQVRYIPSVLVHENEVKLISLPVFDKDNDVIKCRWPANFSDGGGIYNARIGTLNQKDCTLKISSVKPGSYGLGIIVEDFSLGDQKQSLSKISLQFIITVKAASLPLDHLVVNCTLRKEKPLRMVPMVANKVPIRNTTNQINPFIIQQFAQIDPCKGYQLLKEPDRAVTYSDWSFYRCDMQLSGWYRFSEQAGNRILSSCPAMMSKQEHGCGSYFQGWLQPQSHPSVSEGEVVRTVCFSVWNSCNCAHSKQIKIKNCGKYHVYFIDGVPKCDSRYCGEMTTGRKIHCSSNYMRVDLDRSYYNQSLYSSITLRSPTCKASHSSSQIFLGTVLGGCGSTTRTLSNYVVIENEVIMKAKAFDGMIVREPDRYITVYCSYPVNGFTSVSPFRVMKEVNATEPGFGNFRVQLDMHANSFYNSKYNKFPVGVQLTDHLYFEVSTTAKDDFVLLIDQCFSTPENDRNHPDKRLFINERCSTRNDVKFYKTTRTKQRFSLKASELLKSRSQAYVHCLVFLCFHKATEDRCKSGCAGNNLQRTTRSVTNNAIYRPSDVSQLYLVEIGAIKKEKDQKGNNSVRRVPVGEISIILMAFVEMFLFMIG